MKTYRHVFSFCALALIVGGALLWPTESKAQMNWRFQNVQDEPVQIEFYSQNRKAEWPGNGKAMTLNDQRPYKYLIDCNPGERICYGAWSTKSKKYWGVGPKNKYSCSDCCFYCDGTVIPKQFLR